MEGKRSEWLVASGRLAAALENGETVIDMLMPDGRRFGELTRSDLIQLKEWCEEEAKHAERIWGFVAAQQKN